MSQYRTAAELLTDLRTNLDEQASSTAFSTTAVGFWHNTQLYAELTHACDLVATEIRKLKADYFLKSLESDDGTATILGISYDTSGFAIAAGTREYTLPPDLLELKLIEVITSTYEDVVFEHRDLTDPDFRYLRSITDNCSPSRFLFDVTGERTLTIAPKSDTALNLRIWYVSSAVIYSSAGASLRAFASTDDEARLPNPLYSAVVDFATARALIMDRDGTGAVWEQKAQATLNRWLGAHARQTQDVETVRGLFD